MVAIQSGDNAHHRVASLISIVGDGGTVDADRTEGAVSATIGTNAGAEVTTASSTGLHCPTRISRRQPNTCCGQTCHRRATSDTFAPADNVSATIRAFSSADHRRRRPGPVRTSTRLNALFASSLTSNITNKGFLRCEADAKIPLDERGGRGAWMGRLWRFPFGRSMSPPIAAAGQMSSEPSGGATMLRRGTIGRVASILWVTVTAIG